jgi:hypothetical protein
MFSVRRHVMGRGQRRSAMLSAVAAALVATVSLASASAASAMAPAVTGVAPAVGPEVGFTRVTITGSNVTGATGVKFGSHGATSFKVESATSIVAFALVGAGSVNVSVTTAEGVSAETAADDFRYFEDEARGHRV